MKPIPLTAVLILATGLPTSGQSVDTAGGPGQTLIRMEYEWGDAIVKRDADALDRILADDYVLTTPEGRVVPKPRILANFRAPRPAAYQVRGIDHDEVDARVYGDAAVVSSRFILKVRAAGRDVETPFRHTDVFVKQRGQWRCVARQATRIAESYDPAGDHSNHNNGSNNQTETGAKP
jgi:ketosteroid isomerase-like protein